MTNLYNAIDLSGEALGVCKKACGPRALWVARIRYAILTEKEHINWEVDWIEADGMP